MPTSSLWSTSTLLTTISFLSRKVRPKIFDNSLILDQEKQIRNFKLDNEQIIQQYIMKPTESDLYSHKDHYTEKLKLTQGKIRDRNFITLGF